MEMTPEIDSRKMFSQNFVFRNWHGALSWVTVWHLNRRDLSLTYSYATYKAMLRITALPWQKRIIEDII